jgi:putative Holliday junction resolvase
MSRVLAVDPGDVRLGLAISDPLQIVARPLQVIEHRSRDRDAQAILEVAQEHQASLILIGVPYDQDGRIGPQARKSLRLIERLQELGLVAVEPWDESGSTQIAYQKNGNDSMLDAHAAAIFLQDYLDAQNR